MAHSEPVELPTHDEPAGSASRPAPAFPTYRECHWLHAQALCGSVAHQFHGAAARGRYDKKSASATDTAHCSGNRVITLLEPALEALKAQRKLTALQPKTEIVFNHREYGAVENQSLRFVFIPRLRKGEQKAYYSLSSIGARFNAAVKRAGIRRRNPYHTRHTFACWLLSAGANPSFIASQMGHENAQMVYEVYGAWIEEMNGEQVLMLNDKLAR